jgi:hypothetical protein
MNVVSGMTLSRIGISYIDEIEIKELFLKSKE